MKNQNINPKQKAFAKTLLLGFILCSYNILCNISIALAADGNGTTGIQNATTAIEGYFTVGTKLMYAIGAIVGIIGAVKVFNKWNAGEPDTTKVAAAWFGSCVFLVVVATILKGFFTV